MLRIFNTLSREIEEFKPIDFPKVKMYSCGPTVYDYAHIGNFRTFVTVDFLRRYLKWKKYEVLSVMNITDIDDKTIKKSNEEGVSLKDVTLKYENAFFEDLKTLNCMKSDIHPRATEHIDEMIQLCTDLEKKGLTYISQGSLYFRISSFEKYGILSKIDKEGILEGARIDSDEYEKESARDFVLWKGKKEGEPFWGSPWGDGRPGWHLECSAMSRKYLGEMFDIHTGGVDLIFPHHENEIAQSCGATGIEPVKYWFHIEHLLVNGEKMSKSKGNFYTLRDLVQKGYDPMAIRFLLLSVPYRKRLNFTLEGIESAKSSIKRIESFKIRLEDEKEKYQKTESLFNLEELKNLKKKFEESLEDDLNTAEALGGIFEYIREANSLMDKGEFSKEGVDLSFELISEFEEIFGISVYKKEILKEEVERKILEREEARKRKDFALADKIRNELKEKGVILEDTPKGVRWRKE
jgi:cysteinyl-tRNA synthetase